MTDRRTSEYRDESLGAALRELDVPEHRPGFHDELRRRLTDERVVPVRPARAPRRRFNRRRVGLALVAAAVAAAVVAIGIPRGGDESDRLGGPDAAFAAIKAKVTSTLESMRNLSGVLVYDGPERGDKNRWRFTLTAKGDFALVGPTSGERITYDASTGVARSAQRSESLGGGPLFYAERTGVAPGLPDPSPPTWLVPTDFAAFVRALLAADDARVQETTYDGRPAWVLGVDTVPNAIVPEFTGDRFQITVDQASGMPVRVLETKKGEFLRELRIRKLKLNSDLAPGTFRLDFPSGAEVSRTDEGFERVGLGEVEGVVGYAPLVPSWVPKGYELVEVAVARKGTPTGTEGGNPVSKMVVSLSYRRGLDQFLVTTRLNAGGPWSDPLATGEGFVDKPEHVVLEGGALDGRSADLLVVPRGIPHLWTKTDGLVVTVGGALGRAELLRVAGSLAAR
ncbi:MAG TPA: hypothetical protein VFW80_08390 [Gaiellaceae bacterium]|nr:hypothetical protein [Gaiellaceae bacterium]